MERIRPRFPYNAYIWIKNVLILWQFNVLHEMFTDLQYVKA
jgi:hypothetical protein